MLCVNSKNWWVVFGVISAASPAFAQNEDMVPEELREAAMTKTSTTVPNGWKVTAKLGGSFNVSDARNVVGATEGTAIQVGVNIAAEAKYKHDQHTWDTVLSIQEALARTPTADGGSTPFIKSLDILDIVSTYVYRFEDPSWLGPFAQLKLNTQLFPTTSEPTEDYTLIELDTDGEEISNEGRVSGQSFDQTGSFEPLLLRQTVGLFAEPYAEDILTVNFKVGLSAQEVLAYGGSNLTVDGTVYTLREIPNTFDLGVSGAAEANGYILKDILLWKAGVVAFLPFVTAGDVLDADGNELDTIDRLNLEVTGALSLKLNKYIAAEWNLLIRRFPQIVDEFQVQNSFLLTLTVDLL